MNRASKWIRAAVMSVVMLQVSGLVWGRALNDTGKELLVDYAVFRAFTHESSDLSYQAIVDLYVFIFNRQLTFQRQGDGFAATYTVDVFVSDPQGSVAFAKSVTDSIAVYSYGMTRGSNFPHVVKFECLMPAGKYDVQIMLRDNLSGRLISTRRTVEVPLFEENELLLSSLILGFRFPAISPSGARTRIIPNPTREFGPFVNRREVGVYFEIYGLDPSRAGPLQVRILIKDKNSDVLFDRSQSFTVEEEALSVSTDFSVDNLSSGEYEFVVETRQSEMNKRVCQYALFTVRQSPISLRFKEYDEALEQIRYIATAEEIRGLRNAPVGKRQKALERFWEVRDPTPGTSSNELMIEYYRRLEVANNAFGEGSKTGWKTDRGRIFVLFGVPNDISQIANPLLLSGSVEFWKYDDIGKTFIFVDERGFGNFRLANPRGDDFIAAMYRKYVGILF